MKKRLGEFCLLLFLFAVVGSAQAGDFNGFYVGVNVGGASGTSDVTTTTTFSPTGYFATTSPGAIAIAGENQLNPSSFTGGGQIGYNFQAHHLVIGAEADLGHMQLSELRSKSGTYPCCAPTGFTVFQSISTHYLLTIRPRIGFAFGRLLLYGTGGVAVTNAEYKELFTDTFATARESARVRQDRSSWIAGGGAEFRVAHHWSVKGEFLHADFNDFRTTSTNLTAFTPPIPFRSNIWSHHATLTANIGRMGINFRF
jgi:outer membrane immunogenic protein